jgi:membrane protease YdiL (CAAX protease family)
VGKFKLRNPFVKKIKDDRQVTFAQFMENIRTRIGWVYLLVIAVVIFVELVLRSQAVHDNEIIDIWIAAVLTGLLFHRIAVWHGRISVRSLLEIGSPLRWKEISLGLAGGLAAFGWLYLLDRLFLTFAPTIYVGIFSSNWPYQGWFVVVALLAAGLVRPFGEEILFRGTFLPEITASSSFRRALLITTLLFAFRTLDPFLFIIYLGSGLVFGLLARYVHFRSAMFANMTCNILVILFVVLSH